MFDTLSDRLRRTLGNLTGRGRISEADVDAAMREVRLALLEADVNFAVVKDFVARVKERAMGSEVLDSLTPGQVLRIPPVSGVIYTVKKGDTTASLAKKYSADEGRIIAFNHLPQDGSLDVGDELIIPDGHPAASTVAAPSTIDSRIRSVGTYTQAGSKLAAQKFGYLPDLGDYFRIPTTGYNWGILHNRNGIDVANSCGTAIYAAADGTVTTAATSGWNGGFGKNVKISHPNGTETLYGHLSKVLVKVGQVVGRGDKIGLMGTTGRSTGCHLHFEVHGARNPLARY